MIHSVLTKAVCKCTLLTSLAMTVGLTLCKAQNKLYSNQFHPREVKLTDGPFKHAQDLNIEVLLEYDTDRLLAPFRHEAGLEKKAEYFPNWAGLDGHVCGHYLTALAFAYASTGNEECLSRLEYMIDELEAVAKAHAERYPDWGKGYIGGVPNGEAIWTGVKAGDFRAYTRAWVPIYNIHKTYAGLRDAWMCCGLEKAKKLFLDFCDWGIELIADLDDETLENLLRTEHGGINEVYADAYALTAEEKYLTAAKRYSHKFILDPLAQGVDQLDNLHANTQVPKALGFARIGEVSGDERYTDAGRFFWETVTRNRSLAFGGNSRREHFPSRKASFDFVTENEGPETCNTYNMLKLTENLFRIKPDAEYSDFYERAMFNHILSTQHPEHGGYVYFTPARPRHYRVYSAVNQGMWCCVGSGMENHVKYNQFIYTYNKKKLYVNLFVASELNWTDKGIALSQETAFPYGQTSTIRITEGRKRFALMLRYPSWVEDGQIRVSINGRTKRIKAGPSSYFALKRRWKEGDVVQITTPMHTRVERMPGVKDYVAFMHGPILLGMKTETEELHDLIADDGRWAHIAAGEELPIAQAPVLVCKDVDKLGSEIVPIEGKSLHFKMNMEMDNAISGELEPFSGIHDSRYMIYWLALDEGDHKAYTDSLAAMENESVELHLLVGTYGEAIHELVYDSSKGSFTETAVIPAKNASYLDLDDESLFAVSESGRESGVYSFTKKSGLWERSAFIQAGGADPCYILACDDKVYTADYSGGSLTEYLVGNGTLNEMESTLEFQSVYEGDGPVKGRQNSSHIHQVKSISVAGYECLLVSDLGNDRIYLFEKEGLVLLQSIPCGSGSGPRHLEYNPGKQILYCLTELSGEVIAWKVSSESEEVQFTELQRIKADEVDAGGSADIHLSADGRFLYCSHRLQNDGISVIAVSEDGTLSNTSYRRTGEHPRNFIITPDSKQIIVACRDSQSLEVYDVDPVSGLLSELRTSYKFDTDAPVCVIFE